MHNGTDNGMAMGLDCGNKRGNPLVKIGNGVPLSIGHVVGRKKTMMQLVEKDYKEN